MQYMEQGPNKDSGGMNRAEQLKAISKWDYKNGNYIKECVLPNTALYDNVLKVEEHRWQVEEEGDHFHVLALSESEKMDLLNLAGYMGALNVPEPSDGALRLIGEQLLGGYASTLVQEVLGEMRGGGAASVSSSPVVGQGLGSAGASASASDSPSASASVSLSASASASAGGDGDDGNDAAAPPPPPFPYGSPQWHGGSHFAKRLDATGVDERENSWICAVCDVRNAGDATWYVSFFPPLLF